jgi:hypothetical protein
MCYKACGLLTIFSQTKLVFLGGIFLKLYTQCTMSYFSGHLVLIKFDQAYIILYFSLIVMMGGGTLWQLHKFL